MPRMFAIPADPALGDVEEYDVEATATFLRGAIVLLDANEDVVEAGTDPAVILGFATHDARPDEFFLEKILVAKATDGQKFWIAGDNAPVKADINQQYGVTKDGDGIWHLDGTKTAGSARLYVHSIDTIRSLYRVSVLEANRQAVAG